MTPQDEEGQPQSYEAPPPTAHDEISDDERGRSPTREELEEHNEKIARSRKPMGPEPPEDLAREASLDEPPPPDVPPTPPPEPAEG